MKSINLDNLRAPTIATLLITSLICTVFALEQQTLTTKQEKQKGKCALELWECLDWCDKADNLKTCQDSCYNWYNGCMRGIPHTGIPPRPSKSVDGTRSSPSPGKGGSGTKSPQDRVRDGESKLGQAQVSTSPQATPRRVRKIPTDAQVTSSSLSPTPAKRKTSTRKSSSSKPQQ